MPTAETLSGAGLLGHYAELRRDPLALQRRFNDECGDAGYLRFPGVKVLVLNSPELVGALLVDEAPKFRKSRLIRAALYPLTGDGLFTSEGPLWRRQRKLVAPLFQPSYVPAYASTMSRIAAHRAESWADGAEVDIWRET